jgi:betaine lipid synthase
MNEIFPLREYFKRIYLVDLSPSLCNIARERIRRLHLADLVHVLCDDAVTFELPGMPDADGNVDLITMSYSLSMMPSYDLLWLDTEIDILPSLIRSINSFRKMEYTESQTSTLLDSTHLQTT